MDRFHINWAEQDPPEKRSDDESKERFNIGSGEDHSLSITQTKRLKALLFVRPESEFVKRHVINNFNYFHLESGDKFNFACIGYHEAAPGEKVVTEVDGKRWSFSDQNFIKYKDELEKNTKWSYSGGADLILCNEVTSPKGTRLEVNSALCLNLDELVKDKSILSFETFFQGVIKFAKGYSGANPAGTKSDSEGMRLVLQALKETVLGLLPKGVRKSAKDAFNFAERDISR